MEILFRAGATSQEHIITGCDEDEGAPVVMDVLCEWLTKAVDLGEREVVRAARGLCLDSMSTHGTGCTLGAPLACALARGLSRTLFVSRLQDFFRFIPLHPR